MYNVLILGSGRSGTSMLTGVLHQAGYFVGENPDYLKKNKANPKGFFEDYEVNTINEDLLKENLLTIPEPIRKRFFPSATFYRARWLSVLSPNKKLTSSQSIHERIETVITRQPFCFKDPRFSYTLPIWHQALPSDTKYIVVFREPGKTADSIVRECLENKALKRLKMTRARALSIWYSMYSHILKHHDASKNKQHWMFFHYDHIFDAQRVSVLESFLNLSLNVDFAEKQLSRAHIDPLPLPKKIEDVYKKLIHLS